MLIDPKLVYELYLKHKKKPITGPSKTDECCCALNIIALDELDKYLTNTLCDWAIPKYGLDFARGFWMGFDSCGNNDPALKTGYNNGVAVRNFLIEKGILDAKKIG